MKKITFLAIIILIFSIGIISSAKTSFASSPDLFVASFNNYKILQYDGTTGAFKSVFVNDVFEPVGLTFGPDGNLYASNTDQILRYDVITRAFKGVFVASGSGGDQPRSLTFGPDGNLYVQSFTNQILRFDGTTGAFKGVFIDIGSDGGLSSPFGLTFGPDGNLYVSNEGNNEITRHDGTTGAFKGVFVSAGSGGLSDPYGLVFRPDGNLYVESLGNNEILRYDGTTGAFKDVFVSAGSGGLDGPRALAFGPDTDTPPTAPQNLQATAGVRSVTLTWDTPTNNGGSPITGYKIYRSTSSGTETGYVSLGKVNSYTNTGLTPGVTYFYKVGAVNSVGISPLSNEASATPPTVQAVLQNLIDIISNMALPDEITKKLDAKLDSAISLLNSGKNNTAKNQLQAFINEVNALGGKQITTSQANQLINAGQNIIDSIH